MKPNIKSKRILTLFLLPLLALSFIGIFISSIPKVQASTPSFTMEFSEYTVKSFAEINPFGTIDSGTAFNPANEIGNGLVIEMFCQPGGTINTDPASSKFNQNIPAFQVSSITDSLGDKWNQIGSPILITNPISSGYKNPYQAVWTEYTYYTDISSTSQTSMTIDINLVPTAGCIFFLFLANIGISFGEVTGDYNVELSAGTGLFCVNDDYTTSNTSVVPVLSNQLLLSFTWINTDTIGTGYSITLTPPTQFSQISSQDDGVGFYGEISQQYNPPASNSESWSFYSLITGIPCGSNFYVGKLVILFNTKKFTQITGCSGQQCGIGGGGGVLDQTTSYSLTANMTYFYAATSGSGGAVIQNITSKIASYTNVNSGKGTDTYMLAVYTMPVGTNYVNYSVTYNPFTRIFDYNGTIGTGATNQWIHAGTINVGIGSNTSYLVTFISKFSGLTLYHSLDAPQMYNDSQGTFSGSTWSPPYVINEQSSYANYLFLEWFGVTNPIVVITSTATSTFVSCATMVTCSISTATSFYVSTTTIQSLNNIGGALAITGNLINYWPLWTLPLFFIPFGLQGILIGFIMGLVVAGILAIIPLWAAFMMALAIFYLLQKRF